MSDNDQPSSEETSSGRGRAMYYGGGSRAMYYGGASPAVYHQGTPAGYGGYGGAYYGGGLGAGGEEDDTLMGAVTIGRMIRVCSQRWVTIVVFVILGFIAAFAVFKISPTIYEDQPTQGCARRLSRQIWARPLRKCSIQDWRVYEAERLSSRS